MDSVAPIEDAIADIKAGRMVILVDDEDRENEGDLVIAADRVTPEAIAFMVEHGRGLICLAMDGALLERLELAPMAVRNDAPLGTAFTESIDALACAGTGASARDRARTIREAISPTAGPRDFRKPGHIFPLRARAGGVLVRSGQTEGSVDLARLAGFTPAGVICEVMDTDGTMQRLPALLRFGAEHGIKVVTVADLIDHRLRSEPLVVEEARCALPTRFGTFEMTVFRSLVDDAEHTALTMGTIERDVPTLVRVHRADVLADAFRLEGAPHRAKLDRALAAIADEGRGVLVYLSPPSTGEALSRQLRDHVDRAAGRAPERTPSNAPAAFREFGTGAQILRQLGVGAVRVLTNQPRRLGGVSGFGLEIAEWVPLDPPDGVDSASAATP